VRSEDASGFAVSGAINAERSLQAPRGQKHGAANTGRQAAYCRGQPQTLGGVPPCTRGQRLKPEMAPHLLRVLSGGARACVADHLERLRPDVLRAALGALESQASRWHCLVVRQSERSRFDLPFIGPAPAVGEGFSARYARARARIMGSDLCSGTMPPFRNR
jgi:hypothetical protein